ncbi:efflux RND transporter periplasmic adaptor subunit [Haliovirga abyssi]|uniref:Acriflavin resistance protein n=1 Tax=Haliovirga abyssi TaxID=2996794 RepID=A0AAU9DIA7_9FUSO|nr:efflux RND transporter periplasmic adaptor subunit [Haliovirga abyssi]BDU49512.1 acriflavin resistance protein [Haliovirga abyssi]
MKNIKKILIGVMAINLLFVYGCGKNAKKEGVKTEKIVVVRTVELKKMELSKRIEVGAEAKPFKEVVQITETGGDVKKVDTINGRWVKEGETIVELENTQIEASYMQAKAAYLNAKANYERTEKFAKDQLLNRLAQARFALTSAKMNLEKVTKGARQEDLDRATYGVETAKKNYEVMKSTYEKNKKLYEKKLISEQAFLNIENGYKSSENGYKSAKKGLELLKKGAQVEDRNTLKEAVKNAEDGYNLTKKMVDGKSWKYDIQAAKSGYIQAEAMYKLAKKNYNDLTVKAKISGVVINLDLKEKNRVNPMTPLFRIVNNDDMVLEVGLAESEIEGVQKFNKVRVKVKAVNSEYEGQVYEINPAADPKTKKFKVKIKFKNVGHKIKKGMFANAIILAGKHEALVVPKAATVVENLSTYIFKEEENRAEKIKVKLGDSNDRYQEIISDNISEGDKIIVEGQFILNDKDKVKEVK